jgi:hypothetical protein
VIYVRVIVEDIEEVRCCQRQVSASLKISKVWSMAYSNRESHATALWRTQLQLQKIFLSASLPSSCHPLARRIAIEAHVPKAVLDSFSNISCFRESPRIAAPSVCGLAETRRHRSSFFAAHALPPSSLLLISLPSRPPRILALLVSLLCIAPAGLRLHSRFGGRRRLVGE